MAEQLEWVWPFKTIIYSRDQLHRNRLSSAGTAEDQKSIVCLRNIDGDEVAGYLKFKVNSDVDSMNEIGDTAKSLFTKFENSMLLKGFVLKKTEFGELKCVNCQGKSFSLYSELTATWNVEGKTKSISKNDIQQIATFFNDIETDPKLLEMANDIKSQEKIRRDVGNFVWCWILFNKIYNPYQRRGKEWELIKCHVNGLDAGIDSLINRNSALFDLLSRYGVERTTGNRAVNISNELEKAIQDGRKKDIVIKSIDCVYQLRNRLFHYGELDFKDLPRLTNFVFDLVYLDQIVRYGENAVTSFYDIQ